jgi:hypothetical protein
LSRLILNALVLVAFAVVARGGTILINFETVPVEPTGPSLFADASAETVVVPGVATISGGTILGNETLLPAQAFGTPPNVYATGGFGVAGLLSTLTISIDPAFSVGQVSFPLFNASTQTESYVIDAFDGATLASSETLSDLASNEDSGYGIVDLTAPNITSVTIAPSALDASCCGGWDYSIDSVALNESVQTAFVPEPGTLGLCSGALLLIAFLRIRRDRKA